MADNWQPGDLALCVDGDRGWVDSATGEDAVGPAKGSVNTVVSVQRDVPIPVAGGVLDMLVFREFDPEGYDARCFRKIKPLDAEDEALFKAELAGMEHALRLRKRGDVIVLPKTKTPAHNV